VAIGSTLLAHSTGSKLAVSAAATHAANRRAPTPLPIIARLWRSTSHITSRALAPRAMRTPISGTHWFVRYARTLDFDQPQFQSDSPYVDRIARNDNPSSPASTNHDVGVDNIRGCSVRK
jgi:hypothetical protein